MDGKRPLKRLFYGDVATSSRRQGDHVWRYKYTLKTSPKRLQINPANWEDLVGDRQMWNRTVKTGAAIFEDNRIAAAKAERETRKSQLPPPLHNVNTQTPPRCPRCQQTFRAPIGLVRHLRTSCSTRTAPTVVSPSTLTNFDRPSKPSLPSSSSHPAALTSAAVASTTTINATHNPDTPTNTNTRTRDEAGSTPVLIALAPSPHTSA
ncbi:hypothetical protein SprV_0602198600 [Sparganum proliferum]